MRAAHKLLCFILAAVLAAPLAGCATDTADKSEDTEIIFDTVPADGPYSVQEFELTDVMNVFARRDDVEYAVASPAFGVDHTVFEALFNLMLYFETTPGDGELDEFDEYFASGALDMSAPIRSQKMPDKDVYWYSDTMSRALKVCYDCLHFFEYAAANSMSPISRLNEGKVRKIIGFVDKGYFGSDLTQYFGERADLPVLRAAAALYVISDDPSAFVAQPGINTAPRPEYETDRYLMPEVAPAFINDKEDQT